MFTTQTLVTTPAEAHSLEQAFRIVRRSIDARQRNLKITLSLLTDDQGHFVPKSAPFPLYQPPAFQDVAHATKTVEIVGAGPAGLFAALTLIEHGIKPVIYERGKHVSDRKRDIATLNRNQGFNPESNYCFGEGGAGTFSDGKLFSRSKKRGDMQRVMELFHYFGAPDNVLYEAHAHIGSDKLPRIITAMREQVIASGGEIHFCEKWSPNRLLSSNNSTTPIILAIGHSAHDTYRELDTYGVTMQTKGFAMGVRLEHPQHIINNLMYHHPTQAVIDLVGNASYALVTQVQGRGVYSFCMCPGGHIVPAGSEPNTCVVNGMSASQRNSPFANSGMVVQILPEDCPNEPLAGLHYQEQLEQLAFLHGSEPNIAPAQRMKDFVDGRDSSTLPPCSYLPGIRASRLDNWLPQPIATRLQQGFRDFDKKYHGFLTNDAVLLGVESRSSSPVRIVRDTITRRSTSHPNLYPVGEGAGYAGGITSSALDGIQTALAIVNA